MGSYQQLRLPDGFVVESAPLPSGFQIEAPSAQQTGPSPVSDDQLFADAANIPAGLMPSPIQTPQLSGLPGQLPPEAQGPDLQDRQDGPGWMSEIHNALERGGLHMVASVPGTLAAITAPQTGPVYSHYQVGRYMGDQKGLQETTDTLQAIAKTIYTDAQRDEIAAQKKGIAGYIVNTTFETLPMMALSTAAALPGGTVGAIGSFSVAAMGEGEAAYQEARQAGASENIAQTERLIVGSINGVIEKMQADHVLTFARGGKAYVKDIVAAAKTRAWKKLAAGGLKLEGIHLAKAASEGLEEFMQEAVSIGAATLHGDRIEFSDLGRLGEAGVGGLTAGYGLTAGGAIASTATEASAKAQDSVRQKRRTRDIKNAYDEAKSKVGENDVGTPKPPDIGVGGDGVNVDPSQPAPETLSTGQEAEAPPVPDGFEIESQPDAVPTEGPAPVAEAEPATAAEPSPASSVAMKASKPHGPSETGTYVTRDGKKLTWRQYRASVEQQPGHYVGNPSVEDLVNPTEAQRQEMAYSIGHSGQGYWLEGHYELDDAPGNPKIVPITPLTQEEVAIVMNAKAIKEKGGSGTEYTALMDYARRLAIRRVMNEERAKGNSGILPSPMTAEQTSKAGTPSDVVKGTAPSEETEKGGPAELPSKDVQLKGPDIQVPPSESPETAGVAEKAPESPSKPPEGGHVQRTATTRDRKPESAKVPLSSTSQPKGSGVTYERKRQSEMARTTKKLKSHPIYQAELAGLEDQAFSGAGEVRVYVPPEYNGDVEAYAGEKGRKRGLWSMITNDPAKGQAWDVYGQERGWGDDFDTIMQRLKDVYDSRTRGAINERAFERAIESKDIELEVIAMKRNLLENHESFEDINSAIEDYVRDIGEIEGIDKADQDAIIEAHTVKGHENDQERQGTGEGVPRKAKADTGLFGQEEFRPSTGKTQGTLGLEFEQTEPEAVPVKPVLASEVAKLAGQYDTARALYEAELLGKHDLFHNPENPLPEVHEAWSQATKGGRLFGTPKETVAPQAPKAVESKQETSSEPATKQPRTGRDRPSEAEAPAEAPAEPVPAPQESEQADSVPPERTGTSGTVSGESDGGGKAVRGDTRGDSGDVDKPARRGKSPRRNTRSGGKRDYRITESDDVEAGGARTKYKANVAAIKTLKAIEAEGRLATAEEQAILVKYTGWGGLKNAFEGWQKGWEDAPKELQGLLTEDEYASARRSTPNAHYTSPSVVSGMWDGIKRLGFKGGRINEPAIGTGLFYGLIPDDVAAGSQLFGVELDAISARIAKQLYQSAAIENRGFQDVKYPDNFFDLFVSNVPFDERTHPHDPDMPRSMKFNLHDFYFAKALKKTRPGGLVAFITSKGTLDKLDPTMRKWMAKQADFVGAIRLPRSAFGKIANTEVVTDIIVFQKRQPGDPDQSVPFLNVKTLEQGDQTFKVNEYFVEHPDHILGTLSYAGSMYGANEMTVEGDGADLQAKVAEIMGQFDTPTDINAGLVERDDAMHQPEYERLAPDNVKERAYVIEGKDVYQNVDGALQKVKLTPTVARRFKKMIGVRDAARKLISLQVNPKASEADIDAARKALNKQYDAFVKQYKAFHENYNQRLFYEDPDLPLLLALENWDHDTKTATKAKIFEQRTQFPVKTITTAEGPDDAVAISMSEKGRLDIDYIASLLGIEPDAVGAQILGQAYENPETGVWDPTYLYLSGNVRQKLEAAKAAAELDPRYKPNIEALDAVQPEDIEPIDISVRLGAAWIPGETYERFIAHLTGRRTVSVKQMPHDGSWVLTGNATNPKWETRDFSTVDLLKNIMNQRQPKVYEKKNDGARAIHQERTAAAQATAQKIREEFTRWIWQDAEQTKHLARIYNDTFNNTVNPKWDGSYLRFPGQSHTILKDGTLRPHQSAAVARFLTNGNLLLAHAVGAGKTFAGISMAMEARRTGLAKKPVFVVPNHKVDDWRVDFMKLYPSANILASTKDDFKPKNRQRLMHRIATGDWDAVIVPMTSFERIPMSPARVKKFFDDQIDELEMMIRAQKESRGPDSKSITKQLEKSKTALEERLKKMSANWKKDQGPYFDELGIDMLFVDESHAYKNLFFTTKMERVAGLQISDTQRSIDMFLKTQYLNETTNHRGIVFATGTPITNTIGEMYTLQRYLQPQALKAAGVEAFDFWANTFGDTVTDVEVDPTGGGFRMNTRFAKFTNLPELMQMFRGVADIVTKKQMGIPLPKLKTGKPIVIQSEPTPEVTQYIDSLVDRYDAVKKGSVDPKEDNALKITNDGRHVALDARLRIPGAKDHPNSKINQCAREVKRIYDETDKDKGTQIIWCDLSTPGAKKGWSVYDEIKQKLIAAGVKEEEIAFIHDAKNEKQQASLYLKMNRGQVRVILASTEKMGTGANVQQRLKAAHHLTAPWVPAAVEQRDGRIERQGNMYEEVEVYQYVTKGTFDAYMWQTLETKAKFIEQAMNGETTARDIEDISKNSLTFAEVKALASGNPKILEAIKLDADVKNLQVQERAHLAEQIRMREQAHTALPAEIKADERAIPALEKDADTANASLEKAGSDIDITIGKTHYAKRKDAGEALGLALADVNKLAEGPTKIGSAYGFTLQAEWLRPFESSQGWWRISLIGKQTHTVDLGESDAGNITRIVNAVGGIADALAQRKARLAARQARLADIQKEMDKPFEKAKELAEKKERLVKLQAELQAGDKPPSQGDTGFEADPTDDETPSGPGGFVRVGRGKRPVVKIVQKGDTYEATVNGTLVGRFGSVQSAEDAVSVYLGEKKMVAKPWLTLEKTASPDGDIEAMFARTHVMPVQAKIGKFFEVIRDGLRERFIPRHHLAKGKEAAVAHDLIRTMPEERRAAADQAIKEIEAIVYGDGSVQALDNAGLDLLRRKVFARDLLREAEMDRSNAGGIDVEQWKAEDARLDALIAKVPSVKKAYDARQRLWEKVSADLYDRGVINAEARNNQAYVRHFVLTHAKVARMGSKKKKLGEPYRGYGKHRKGSKSDISTHYLAVEIQALTEIYRDNAVEDAANEIGKHYDQRPKYKRIAKARNFTTLVGGPKVVARIDQLREAIRASKGEDASDRAPLIQELEDIDPTYPYRKRIAIGISKLEAATGEDLGLEDSQGFFARVAHYAKAEPGSAAGLASRMILKAINEREQMIRDALGDAYVTPEQVAMSDDYVEWHYKRPNVVYMANTLPEFQAAALVENMAEEAGEMIQIPKEAIRRALVMGGKRKGFLVPSWLARQLDDLPVNKRSGLVVESFTKPAIQFIKRWYLRMNPLRYNFRNEIGDVERLNASGQTDAIKYIPLAVKLLITKTGELYQKMLKYGVVGSSLWHEMNDPRTMKQFERFKDLSKQKTFRMAVASAFKAPLRVVQGVGNVEQALTQFREDLLRAAVFLSNLDKIENGKKIRHWAGDLASVQELVDSGYKYRAAAKISRETMVDYGDFTPWENDVLRNGWIPFYSWMKKNLVFWPKAFKNAALEDATGAPIKAAAKVGLVNVPAWSIRVLFVYGLAHLWNHRDDEAEKKEESLPFWLRSQPHVNIGDRTYWGDTALADFTEWSGMEELSGIAWRREAGFLNGREAALEAAKAIAQAPVNKVYQALNPFFKQGQVAVTGTETYPNVFAPRIVAKGASGKSLERAIVGLMGADAKKFYQSAKGSRAFDDTLYAYFAGWFCRPTDPETFIEEINRTEPYVTLKGKSASTGRQAGEAKKGREDEWQELQVRKQAIGAR